MARWWIITLTLFTFSLSTGYAHDTRVGDTIPLKETMRAKGAVLVFSPSVACAGCMVELREIAERCGTLSVPIVVYIRSGRFSPSWLQLKKQCPNIELVDDELGVYADLYRMRVAPMLIVVGGSGKVLAKGVPGATSLDLGEVIAMIGSPEMRGPSDVFYGPAEYHAVFDGVVRLALPDTIGPDPWAEMRVRFHRESGNILFYNCFLPFEMYLLDSTGRLIDQWMAAPNLGARRSKNPLMVWFSEKADSILMLDIDPLTLSNYVYWYWRANNSITNVSDIDQIESSLNQAAAYNPTSGIIILGLRNDSVPTFTWKQDPSTFAMYSGGSFRFAGRRPTWYEGKTLPSLTNIEVSTSGEFYWTMNSFSGVLTRYSIRTGDSSEISCRLPSVYHADPMPWLKLMLDSTELIRDPRTRYSEADGLMMDQESGLVAITHFVPIEHLTGVAPHSARDWTRVAVVLDMKTGKVRSITEFPFGVTPLRMHRGRFLCRVVKEGTNRELHWYRQSIAVE
ncbi:MAG: hypothetical protein FGM33_04300 [Candidatus Kapabacteria bacterium]|nr:hypothetical protein [Candidatus Kapabacteria bacterium]